MLADLLIRQGVSPALAIAYAKAFRLADNHEKRQRIIDNLNLSHPMVAMAIYGDSTHGKKVS